MDVREKLVEIVCDAMEADGCIGHCNHPPCFAVERVVNALITHGVTVQECARPLEEWGEDYGDVLWWKFPIEEPPYVGSPLDEKWPAYHTHWMPIVIPQPPKGE